MNNATFRSIQSRLRDLAETATQTELHSKEQDLGFKWNPDSWLQDSGLDVQAMKVLAFDWMHCWCENGVWEIEFGACMDLLSPHGHGGRQLHAYLQLFKWPQAYASGRDVCKGSVQERSTAKDVRPAGSASELISVGPVVRKWLEDVVKPKHVCPAQVTSLLLCIKVMDLLVQVNSGSIAPATLATAIAAHYAAHVVAYGYSIFVPKHHFMLHIPNQLERFGFLVSCFVHERKHKIVKRWAVPLATGDKRDYERSLLEECTLAHISSLKDPLLKPCLIEAVGAAPKIVAVLRSHGYPSAESARTGRDLRVHGRTIRIGDVVLYRGDGRNDFRVGEVDFHASLGGDIVTRISHWPVDRETSQWKKLVVKDDFAIVSSAWLSQSLIFTPAKVGAIATALMPPSA